MLPVTQPAKDQTPNDCGKPTAQDDRLLAWVKRNTVADDLQNKVIRVTAELWKVSL
jgi:hypothetical protein